MTHAAPQLTLFIDGLCPLCKREARTIKKLDKDRGIVELIDITDKSFDPSRYGKSMDDFMGAIHAERPDGSLISGMEVFRKTYAALGWGWLWAPTGWPVLKPVFDLFYRIFAKLRPRLSGHKTCSSDRCAV